MKFGVKRNSWLYGPDPVKAFEAVKAKAQWAENRGFVWFSVLDHMIQIPRVGPPDEPFLEGWTVLSGLAAVTSRIRLATLCTAVGYRNPAHLAKIAATVDLISRGRLTLGIGAGFFEEEYKQYGWEFPPRPATRIRQVEEAVQLILKMWTEPRTTFHGRYFHVEDAILEPKPVQKPRPPVMIAGGGEQMTLRAVARLADAQHRRWRCRGGPAQAGGVARTLRPGGPRLRHNRKDSYRALAPCPRCGCAPRKVRTTGRPRSIARLCRDGVRGHRGDRAIPGRGRRPPDLCRSTKRRGKP